MTRMNVELYERRIDFLKLHNRGVKPSAIAKELEQKYNVFASSILRDWNERSVWLPVVMKMQEPETVAAMCRQENKQVKESAWSLFHNAENDTAKCGALRLILDVNDRELELAGYSRGTSRESEEDKRVFVRDVDFNELPEDDRQVLLDAETVFQKYTKVREVKPE